MKTTYYRNNVNILERKQMYARIEQFLLYDENAYVELKILMEEWEKRNQIPKGNKLKLIDTNNNQTNKQ